MADLVLVVTIEDVNVQALAAGFLKKCPMPKIDDPENPGEEINKFPTTKEWAEDWLEDKILRVANFGIEDLKKELAVRLTKAIFKH